MGEVFQVATASALSPDLPAYQGAQTEILSGRFQRMRAPQGDTSRPIQRLSTASMHYS